MFLRILVSAAIVTALTTAAAPAATPTHVIIGDISIGGLRIGRATPPEAIARFTGDGVHRTRRRGLSCSISWPRIGLTLGFGVLGTDATNPCIGGALFAATITSRHAWRTAVGLRVGDGAARARMLYPHAALHSGGALVRGYWLITRHLCLTVGGSAYPGLLARMRNGRVTALVAAAGICE